MTTISGSECAPGNPCAGVVRRLRRVLDLSQRGLAAAAGVSPSTVARAESDEPAVSLRALTALLAVGGYSVLVVDADGAPVVPMRRDAIRDRGGRRHPAHLDARVPGTATFLGPREQWLRWDRPVPALWCERRPARDVSREREGVPFDHPGPGEVVEQRRRDRERAIRLRASRTWAPSTGWLDRPVRDRPG